jgi:hypothetical protein
MEKRRWLQKIVHPQDVESGTPILVGLECLSLDGGNGREVSIKFDNYRLLLRDNGDHILRTVQVLHLHVELTPFVDDIVALRLVLNLEIASNELVITLATDLDDIEYR